MSTAGNQQQTALVLNPRTIVSELEKMKPQIEAALPRHMNPDRMARIALTCMRITPKLFSCTPDSFFGSIIAASQLGLEPNVLGQCYLIPYGTVCTLVPGWKGYMDLLSRTGRAAAWTGAVYDGDEFSFEYGDRPSIHHKPGKWSKEVNALIYTYSVGRQKGMEWPAIDVWDVDKIVAHRNKMNKVGDRHYSFTYFEMYARKIPLLQVVKYLPSSVEMANASALDIAATEGRQKLTIDMALKGELEGGGEPVEDTTEAEKLMDDLHYDDKKRDAAREMYRGRVEELVDYLKGELAKGNGNGQKSGGSAQRTQMQQETKQDAQQAKQQPAQQAARYSGVKF
jgi:recombination protein RecT